MENTTFLDQKYINLLSGRLRNFRSKGDGLFEFSHSCERADRRRGYLYKKGTGYNLFCHNCGHSVKFFNFLKEEDAHLYKQYCLELFQKEPEVVKKEVPKKKKKRTFDVDGLSPADDNSESLEFLKSRSIPETRYNECFYTEDFNDWASSFYPEFKEKLRKESRIIFPYIDNTGNIFGFTCRSLGDSKPKYIVLKLEDKEMIYGLNHLNLAKQIYCVEGPIDSMFLDNGIAVGGASYEGEFIKKYKQNLVIVPDNDWIRNKQVCEQILKKAKEGFRISLFPDNFDAKDINEAIIKGYSKEDIKKIIDENIKSGSELILDITFRRKC